MGEVDRPRPFCLTDGNAHAKMVADETIANETVLNGTNYRGEEMPAISRGLNILSRCIAMYRTQQYPNDDFLPVHYSYVLAICNNPGMSQDKLAKHLCLNKSNVTRHLTQLEKNGYVERRASETDKREMLVFPTEKMKEAFVEVRRITDDWNKMLSADFSEEELTVFSRILDKMIERSIEMVYPKGGCKR